MGMEMSLEGAVMILENGLEYNDLKISEDTDYYHYFIGSKHVGSPNVELRVSKTLEADEQFHIQERSCGSEYWNFIDSVSSDWSQEE
jgi:hypothetical protein